MLPFCSLLVFIIPLLAVAGHYLYYAQGEAPPSHHGTGSMFDLIAGRYDVINRVLAVGMDTAWRQRMVESIGESVSDRTPQLLDLASGTADVALLLAQHLPDSTVVGVDPSAQMLAVGREKVKRAGLQDRIELRQADSRDLQEIFPSPSIFDGATMAFGIRNVPSQDRQTALCQIHRLLKNDARFCILEFSEPDDSFGILGRVARLFIRHVVPVVGGILSGKPREYWHLQNSIKDFPTPNKFVQQLNELECTINDNGNDPKRAFEVEDLIQLNFGSVQTYVLKTLGSDSAAQAR